MSTVAVVENPRRRKRRRMSAKQKRYFGPRKSRSRRRPRRRNPALMALGNPRRRRRSTYRAPVRRRRRNPGLPGMDFTTAFWVAGGMIGVRVLPGMVAKVWPGIPRTGMAGYLVKGGTVFLLGWVGKMVTGSWQRTNQLVAGGLASILYDMFNEYLAPTIGLYGMGRFVPTQPGSLMGVNGVGRFVPTQPGSLGYRHSNANNGSYKNRIPTEIMAGGM